MAICPGWVRAACTAHGGIGAHRGGRGGGAHPGRGAARPALGVGGQRRVVRAVVGRLVAHDVDDRRLRAAGVVQVGEAVGEARAAVQQRRRRLAGHARVAVGRAGHHALEQAEHAAHAGHAVECGDEVHLRGAGVAEAGIDAAFQQRVDEAFGAVHFALPVAVAPAAPLVVVGNPHLFHLLQFPYAVSVQENPCRVIAAGI